MREENKFVVGCLLAIAMASLLLVGWIIFKGGSNEPINLLILLASNVSAGFVGYLTKTLTSGKEEPAEPTEPTRLGNSGQARPALIKAVAATWIIIALVCSGMALTSCTAKNQTATQQIAEQTSDPYKIATAVYLDCRIAYNKSLRSYLPYADLLESSNSAAAEKIRHMFNEAEKVLTDYKKLARLGAYESMDRNAFLIMLSDISIEIAKELDAKGGK